MTNKKHREHPPVPDQVEEPAQPQLVVQIVIQNDGSFAINTSRQLTPLHTASILAEVVRTMVGKAARDEQINQALDRGGPKLVVPTMMPPGDLTKN